MSGFPCYILSTMKKIIRILALLVALGGITYFGYAWFEQKAEEEFTVGKPVIYLYPSEPMSAQVHLRFNGELSITYPAYQDGWSVIAHPDGTLINQADGREYSYLFWEGNSRYRWKINEGFVVSRDDVEDFLKEKLEYLGLIPKEYNEFIVYWLPELLKNPYNLIYFAGADYEGEAALKISPEPDSIIRVFMVFQGIKNPIKLPLQKLTPRLRRGFSVVEWGGTDLGLRGRFF